MKTILVPLDFSPVSRRVLQEARKLASSLGARIVMMHVVKQPVLFADYPGLLLIEAPDVVSASERAAGARLTQWRRELAKRGVAADLRIYTGVPGYEIVRNAKKLRPDYIVIGSHGHSAFYNFVVGSTAAAVLQAAPCPVIVVASPPPAKSKPRQPRA